MKMRDLQQYLRRAMRSPGINWRLQESLILYRGSQTASDHKTIKIQRGTTKQKSTQHCWQISWRAALQDVLWNRGIIKNLYLSFNSTLLYPFFTCKKGTTVLKTSVHSKLKQLPIKTNPGQQKHIQMKFSKYIGRWRSYKSQQMKECLDE